MYTRYPEPYCAAFENIPSERVGAEIRKLCQMEESHSLPISPLERLPWNGCKHIPWASLADTASLYLYLTGWWHIAEVSCTLLQGNVSFMALKHLVRKKKMFKRINRAIVCIRMCVICVFYKLSIGGLECSSVSTFFLLLSLRLTWEKIKKSLGCGDWKLKGPNVLARSVEHYFDS